MSDLEITRLVRQRRRDAVSNLDGDEEALLNIYYLVFNGTGTSRVSKKNLSWIQILFMEKTLAIFGRGNLFRKYVKSDSHKYHLKKSTKERNKVIQGILQKIDVRNSEESCKNIMKKYADTVFNVTEDDSHNLEKGEQGRINCQNDSTSITWTAGWQNGISYPNMNDSQVKNNTGKWKKYFGDGRIKEWLNIPAKFHFIWRNRLIPAHEIIHVYTDFQKIFYGSSPTPSSNLIAGMMGMPSAAFGLQIAGSAIGTMLENNIRQAKEYRLRKFARNKRREGIH